MNKNNSNPAVQDTKPIISNYIASLAMAYLLIITFLYAYIEVKHIDCDAVSTKSTS